MKRSAPPNLFELENLEPRILLSGDPLLGAVQIGAPGELDPLSDNDQFNTPAEEIKISDEDLPSESPTRVISDYNPSQELENIFSGRESIMSEII